MSGLFVNKNFFSSWNSEMSYVFGFVVADGCIGVKRIRKKDKTKQYYFNITNKDKSHLENIKKAMTAQQKIYSKRSSRTNRKDYCFIQIGHQKICKDLIKLGILTNNQQFISEDLYKELKIYQPKKDEILLSKDATPGIAYHLKNELKQMIPSGGILRLKVNNQKVLPEYLTLVLNSVIVQKQIERDAGGSIISHWRPDQVKATIIPILKDDKQKEIKELIEKSFSDRKLSKSLLEIAKKGVEIAIEKNEKEAKNWINSEVKKLDTRKR